MKGLEIYLWGTFWRHIIDKHPNLKTLTIRPDGIHILWEDGHESYYNHRYLRSQCCCAHCVSEMTGERLIVLNDINVDVEAVEWAQIGRYAVQFLWSDFHETGIYPFPMLQDLCQCDVCKQGKK